MNRSHRRLLRIALLFAVLLPLLSFAVPAPVLAATPRDEEITDQTVVGSLTVGDGDECILSNTTVIGSVFVEPGGSLTIRAGSTIQGRVEATGQETLAIVQSEVRGSVTATGGTGDNSGPVDNIQIFASSIGGRLTLTGNAHNFITVVDSEVGGSTTINDNTAFSVFQVEYNTIGGSLRCSGNTSTHTFRIDNNTTILGRAYGQCDV